VPETPPEPTPDFDPTGPNAGGEADSESLRLQVGQLTKQVQEYKYAVAEYDTSRRRVAQDAERQRKYAIEPLVKDLITSFDNLELAVKAAKVTNEGGSLAQGVSATLAQVHDTLKRHGVSRIDVQPGTPFDPHLHMAVSQQPTNDFEPGAVLAVLQPGFVLHDRVLRPATVVVASEPPAGGESF
jgi:molecular chaperone GrpE